MTTQIAVVGKKCHYWCGTASGTDAASFNATSNAVPFDATVVYAAGTTTVSLVVTDHEGTREVRAAVILGDAGTNAHFVAVNGYATWPAAEKTAYDLAVTQAALRLTNPTDFPPTIGR